MKTLCRFTTLTALAGLALIHLQTSLALAQGSLTPPGPPAPGMKSLDQIEPRIPVSVLPFNIVKPGSYYLTAQLTGGSGTNGVTIASSDVTLDLNGFTLVGLAGSSNGVYVSGFYSNITVRNGSLRGWGGNGVEVYKGENILLERLAVAATGGVGIDTFGSVVRDCQVDGSGGSGIAAYASTVQHCVVENCGYDGIDAYNSQVSDCVVANNSFGVYVAPGTIRNCLIATNAYSGIYVGSSGCQIIGNNCQGNNANVSTADAGIYLDASNNRVEDNQVTGSGSAGIQVAAGLPAGNIVIKNSVSGNGLNNFVTPGQQVVGPLITTAGTITNTSPWANFSF